MVTIAHSLLWKIAFTLMTGVFAILPAFDARAEINCPMQFRKIGPGVLSTPGKSIAIKSVDRLQDMILKDRQIVTGRLSKISTATMSASRTLINEVASDLLKQGYKVRIARRAMATHFDGTNRIEIPARDVLIITSDKANGSFARELRRFEAYTATRLADPATPQAVRDVPFNVAVDPVLTAVTGSDAHFVVSTNYGTGTTLSPLGLIESSEASIRLMRHELRHLKNYFDIVAGKPTFYRATLVDWTSPLLESKGYGSYFAIDEMAAFTSNVVSTQAKLGRETELMNKIIKSVGPKNNREILSETLQAYRQNAIELQTTGLRESDKILNFAQSTIENVTRTRAIIADPMLSANRLAERITYKKPDLHPGIVEVSIRLTDQPGAKGRLVKILMPEHVTDRGTEATRDYTIKYLNQIEAHARDVQNETQIRMKDLRRDPFSRIAPVP